MELLPHAVGHELGPAQRAGVLIAVHPPVQALPVEDVPAVAEPPDLLLRPPLELVQAHGAALGRVDQALEPDDGQHLPDQEGGDGGAPGGGGSSGRRPGLGGEGGGVGVEEVGEAEEVEEGEDEVPEEAEEAEGVDEELRQADLRVAQRESHFFSLRFSRSEGKKWKMGFREKKNSFRGVESGFFFSFFFAGC